MITEVITTAAEYVACLGLDAAKEHVQDELDEKKLRTELTNYIERQRQYYEMCTMAEEIDFQGLVEYIQNNLLKQAGVRIFNPDRKKRGQARQEIVDTAVAYSKANTDEAKSRVATCISICLDIIYGFYAEHLLSVKDYLLADMIVDAVAEKVHEAQTTMVAAVDSAKDQILAKIDNTESPLSIDRALTLADVIRSGKLVAELSDKICEEHRLSVNKHPQDKTVSYDKWLGNNAKISGRDRLRMTIDAALRMQPDGFDALMQLLEDAGCWIKRGAQISIKPPNGKRYVRLDTLGAEYTEAALRSALAGHHVHIPKVPRSQFTPSQVELLIDIEAKLRAGKGKG